MRALNQNVILKRIETKKKSSGLTATVNDTSNTVVLEVVDVAEGLDKKLIGKRVVVGKYAGEQYDDVLITPFSTLLAVC